MTSEIVPVLDLAPALPSRVVTINATEITEGRPAGGSVTFSLVTDLHDPADGMIVQQGSQTVTLYDGHGAIRLPVYTSTITTRDGSSDWAIIVRKSWDADGPYAIRVPAGTGPINLAAIANVRPLTEAEKAFAPTSVSVRVTPGPLGGYGTLSGGIIGINLTIPTVTTTSDGATTTATGMTVYNVKDYGAVGDGVTDDTAAIKKAVAAAGTNGNIVFFPEGKWRITSEILMPGDQTWVGIGIDDKGTNAGAQMMNNYILADIPSGNAVHSQYNCQLFNLAIVGTNKTGTIGLWCDGSINLYNVSLKQFDTALNLNSVYYGNIINLRTYHNNVAVLTTNIHNVVFVSPRINCIRADGTVGNGIYSSPSGELSIFGGAIEGYNVGIRVASTSQVNVFGTYFETAFGTGSSVPISCTGNTRWVLNVEGAIVYITNSRYWIDASGASTSGSLNVVGTIYRGGSATGWTYSCYTWSTSATVRVFIRDGWWIATNPSAAYLQAGTKPLVNSVVIPPHDAPGITEGIYTGTPITVQ